MRKNGKTMMRYYYVMFWLRCYEAAIKPSDERRN